MYQSMAFTPSSLLQSPECKVLAKESFYKEEIKIIVI